MDQQNLRPREGGGRGWNEDEGEEVTIGAQPVQGYVQWKCWKTRMWFWSPFQ